MPKYIVVTGGVLSGLGKGITAASIGRILINRGLKVAPIKMDPYLNVDCGTMNPYQHGEVWITEDGGEIDLDLGHYERFLDSYISKEHNVTTGQVYLSVITQERKGDFLGQTVQIVPHITDEIKSRIKFIDRKSNADIVIIELGGTVGDIEGMPYLEALRQLHTEEGNHNVIFVHVTLVPILDVVGEFKTKPTQHSVKRLLEAGIKPDIIVCRSNREISKPTKNKIALSCDVPKEAVISSHDVETVYKIPLLYEEQNLGNYLAKKMDLWDKKIDFSRWQDFVDRLTNPKREVTIAIAGKYIELIDSYLSISEAFNHVSAELKTKINIKWLSTEDFTSIDSIKESLDGIDGVLVPGGFGQRGAEGKILTIRYVREHKIPFFGICYGFQLAAVEFARNIIKLDDANSTEINPSAKNPVIDILPEQKATDKLGGTMRLGAYPIFIKKDSIAKKIYEKDVIYERHRHRFEVNPKYIEKFEKNGLTFSGKTPDKRRMEILELKDHPCFVAGQFHPEFKSRPNKPAPMFKYFIEGAIKKKYGG